MQEAAVKEGRLQVAQAAQPALKQLAKGEGFIPFYSEWGSWVQCLGCSGEDALH